MKKFIGKRAKEVKTTQVCIIYYNIIIHYLKHKFDSSDSSPNSPV